MGQGNRLSGNGWYGLRVGGFGHTVLGNYVGVDLAGEKPDPNFDGIFITETRDITVGSVRPGEGNLISGNQSINIDSWGGPYQNLRQHHRPQRHGNKGDEHRNRKQCHA